ncbi:xanthine dehydrogenase FAD-binding subunit XdhB [Candidatus Formimonas warabiya]|uniref:Xanthine dehydrogenase FAD-binding subunit XdhB n=1 Tax=Formimonas warabiya TaxID=1761012 RepID=A0A3G1L0F9_FORW1|nr:xanthine dehydrogenase FAD-binding subunit XdhB [Candidatus Formimonas warabiya]
MAYRVDQAIAFLDADPNAIVIAGGTDVLIKVRDGKLAGCHLVSINGIKELKGVRLNENNEIVIGSLTTFRELEEDETIQRHMPILAGAAGAVGGPQIRAVGTIGGNISNGVTSADTASTLLTLNAELTLTSSAGHRLLPIEAYYLSAGKVALRHGELLTAITIKPADYRGYHGKYIKYAMRNAMDIAILGCAVLIKTDVPSRFIEDIRIALGVAGPVPMRALKTEAALIGLPLEEALCIGPDILRKEITPRDSWRASRAFRLHVAGEIFRQALASAWQEGVER